MVPTFDKLRVRLIQIREQRAVIAEEQASFAKRTRLRPNQFVISNALHDDLGAGTLANVDAVLIGGAGRYSVTETYVWTGELKDLCHACADRRLPLFGSCWGHQFIARAFGGRVIHDRERSEMGTHQVSLTTQGKADPLFRDFPNRFLAQMGHQDRVESLPPGAVKLARNDTAPFQAFRMSDAPIYGTQFHSELDVDSERSRLFAYRENYPEMEADDAFNQTLATLRPTPDVDDLLFRFLHHFAVEEFDHAA